MAHRWAHISVYRPKQICIEAQLRLGQWAGSRDGVAESLRRGSMFKEGRGSVPEAPAMGKKGSRLALLFGIFFE